MATSLNCSIGDVQQDRQLHLAHKNSTLMMLFSSDSGHELWSVDVYGYFEKGCWKKCSRDNPER